MEFTFAGSFVWDLGAEFGFPWAGNWLGVAEGIFQSVLFHRKTGMEEWENGSLAFRRNNFVWVLGPFFPHGFMSSQEFSYSSVSFPILVLFLGSAFIQALQFQLSLLLFSFSWEIQISGLGFVLFPLSRCSRTIPILPSSSSSSSRPHPDPLYVLVWLERSQ